MTTALILLLLKTLVLAMPAGVAWLAVRRLLLSRTVNAWLYAATAVLVIVSCVALTPWVFGQAAAHPFAVGLALMSPAIWLALVIFCGPGTGNVYDLTYPDPHATPANEVAAAAPVPLRLAPDARLIEPVVTFRHRPISPPTILGIAAASGSGSVLDAARAMRANRTSDGRRPKALPPPSAAASDLPFLRG